MKRLLCASSLLLASACFNPPDVADPTTMGTPGTDTDPTTGMTTVPADGASSSDGMETPTCTDAAQNGDETDVDCGGSCEGCLAGFRCGTVADCRVESPECSSTLVCDASKGYCGEYSICDDLDDCTVDLCVRGSGCDNTTPTDIDMDGHFPLNLGCGDDCDDFDDTVNPGISFDLGCSTADSGFGVDNDCDLAIDEDC